MSTQRLWQEQKKDRKMFRCLIGLLEKKEKKELYLCVAFSIFSPIVDWISVFFLILVLGRLSDRKSVV